MTKKKKNKFWSVATWLLGVIGLIVFMAPFLFSWYTSNRQQEDLIKYEQSNPRSNSQMKGYEAFNKFVAENQGHIPIDKYIDKAAEIADVKLGDIIGYMDIPAINLKNQPIYYGDSYDTLAKGLGVLPFTSLPFKGENVLSTITGHSGMANQIFFDNIKFLKKGDLIKTHILGLNLNYKMVDRKIINPNKEGADKNYFIQKDKDMIALMTCTPIFINSHRLTVYAERISDKEAKKIVVPYRAFWSVEHIYLIGVALFILIIAIMIWSLKRRAKNNNENVEEIR